MEKDLRDAYAALKLLRADLVKTRRDKRALEASLTHLQTHGTARSAAQTRESRETQQMQHEDANAQLWRLAAIYENRLAEMEMQLLHNNCQKKEVTPEVEDNQQEEEGIEKLALLNKLHSLTATVEQQTQTMLAQQAAFALQKGDLETTVEDTQHQLQAEKSKAADALLEQQAAKENYEFLETQVEILKQDKSKLEGEKETLQNKLATHAQTGSILQQQLQEKEENEKELREGYQREMVELQRKYGLLELELSSEKEKNIQEIQERYATTLRVLENTCEELKTQIAASEDKRSAEVKEHQAMLAETQETYNTKLEKLQSELEETRNQLATLETSKAIELKEQGVKLEEAMDKLQGQKRYHEQQAITQRDLENNFADVQSKLTAAEVKLAEEAKKYEEQLAWASQKLLDQEQDHERHTISLHDVETDLSEVKTQLADAEAKLLSNVKEFEEKLAQTSQLAAEHEKTARVLAMEKKALQQEVREVRQAFKLKTEEFLKYQSLMELKTLYLNQVQLQRESLETQLLAAEDHKEHANKQIDDSYTLKAFHGLSDTEIAALPPSKSWTLLRSEINEMEEFLPHFQTLVGGVSDVLVLCESHADTLPALCDRLEGKLTSERDQLPIESMVLRLVRFAVMLKARIHQEEAPVTVKSVQALRRRVLDALSQWYECDAGDSDQAGNGSMPTPTFTTTSRETALILQNWTSDRTKQLGVRRWLARMEAYPGVPPLRGASSNRVLELPPEGCTLELEDMTPEVKDAFLLLLIPILKQNRALHVRVFTHYTEDRGITSNSEEDTDKVWGMRIHVQSAVTPPPNSPASSVSSSTSSSASSRLQIIQERLQYLHNNA
ncbi:hypothetical protein PC121_g9276 [Phytophthora cactorum]|nr:hypothetical protein PC120_g7021 [Phytophthora cactorum]KAG3071328.1 hypothetical protein PC121_g9276 [Phytophthora cactorum]